MVDRCHAPAFAESQIAMNESYVFDLGWLFFAVWTMIVAVVSFKAFGSDLFPPQTGPEDTGPALLRDLAKATEPEEGR